MITFFLHILNFRWTAFDDNRAKVFGTPAAAELDLKQGEVAFAEAVSQD